MAILSLQSMVTFGHVGHSAAQFPIQCMGLDYWAIPTVYLSHNKSYPDWSGFNLSKADMVGMAQALAASGQLKDCQALLIGYLGSTDAVEAALDIIQLVKQHTNQAPIVIDPVMGDHHRGFYVSPDIVTGLKERLLPLADKITPNSFEWQTLKPNSYNASVLVTGIEDQTHPGEIGMSLETNGKIETIWTRKFEFDTVPSGSGDLTAALMTGHIVQGLSLKEALHRTAPLMEYVFERTALAHRTELDLLCLKQKL